MHIIILLLILCSTASADVFVTIDKNTKEVISMDKRDEVVLKPEWEKIVLPGNLEDYPLEYKPTDYTYKNNKFVVNVSKMSDEAIEEQKFADKMQELAEVEAYAKKQAYKDMKKEGKVFKELKESDLEDK